MRQYRYRTCDVFTDHPFGGNPLAVLTDARGLDGASMQAIAREFNYSETAFVEPPADPRHTARVRIFTPETELPFAGHPTVGTAFVLASIGATPGASEVVFEEGIGPVRVRIERSGGRITACTLTAPRPPASGAALPPRSRLAAMLGLATADLLAGAAVWSCGVPFSVIPVASPDKLAAIRFDQAKWTRLLREHEGRDVYPVAQVDARTWRVRMFAPALGVSEDPATGSAAAALAGWLASQPGTPDGVHAWRILQGEEIGRPSVLRLEADVQAGAARTVRVGGGCVMVCEGTLSL